MLSKFSLKRIKQKTALYDNIDENILLNKHTEIKNRSILPPMKNKLNWINSQT